MNWDNSKEIKRALEDSEMGGLSFDREHRKKVFKRLQADKKNMGLLDFLPSILSKAALLSVAVFLIGLVGFFVSQELEPESGKSAVTPVVEKEQEESDNILPVEEEKSLIDETISEPTVEPTVDPTEPSEPSFENPELTITIKDNIFYLNNITLGMSSAEVQNVLGTPDYDGPDSEQYWETINEFPNLYIGFYQDRAGLILYKGPFELDKIISEVNAAKYKTQDGDIFLYLKETKNIIKITSKNPKNEYYVYLSYEDGNFEYSLETGYATPF
ncbi:MAG: hypothetical protein AB2392_08635 [Neobacillus sp.]